MKIIGDMCRVASGEYFAVQRAEKSDETGQAVGRGLLDGFFEKSPRQAAMHPTP